MSATIFPGYPIVAGSGVTISQDSNGVITVTATGTPTASPTAMTDTVTGTQYTLEIQNGNLIAVPVS